MTPYAHIGRRVLFHENEKPEIFSGPSERPRPARRFEAAEGDLERRR